MPGHPRQMGHSEEFWQNVVHWRREWQPTPIFLAGKPNRQYDKAKRYDTTRWAPRTECCWVEREGREGGCAWPIATGGSPVGCTWTWEQLLPAGVCSVSFIPRLSRLLNIFTITSVYYVTDRFCLVGRMPEGQIVRWLPASRLDMRDRDSVAHLTSAPPAPLRRHSLASQASTSTS